MRDGPAQSIQTPRQDDIEFAPTRDRQPGLAQFALPRAGPDLFDLRDDGPAALERVFAHGADLQRQRLLVKRRNAGIKAHAKGVAKNLVRGRLRESLFFEHSRSLARAGRILMVVASIYSSTASTPKDSLPTHRPAVRAAGGSRTHWRPSAHTTGC